jgi:hypothetical protein
LKGSACYILSVASCYHWEADSIVDARFQYVIVQYG